jgi:epoxyqueuosine reductase
MSPDLHRLTEAVKEEARRLGFALVGVTTPDAPPHLDVFQAWLAQGRQGEMVYLETPRACQARADPHLLLPDCRSILVLGVNYPVQISNAVGDLNRGKIAAYAWGADYHDVLPERLRQLVAFIETQVGVPVPNRWYTDTGPLLERELAQRAGLGWIGKNTCFISPQAGSYFLLAEILLGIELEADVPFTADRCGSCTRCLEACPTSCILPDRTLDARRCISYLTIELKGSIPIELRPQIWEWVFGCDICQQVCPWNQRFAPGPGDPAFAPRSDVPAPDLIPELALTPKEFNLKFKGSPVKRAKRRGYLRNVAVALGNAYAGTGDQAVTDALASALQHDPEPLVRAHAAWALGQVGGNLARRALQDALKSESNPDVMDEIHRAGHFDERL